MSTPRHQEKLNGHYVSAAARYAPAFLERVREVSRGASFWEPSKA